MSVVGVKHAAQGRTELANSKPDESMWVARPTAVRALRTVAVLLPLAASAGAIYLLNRALPTPTSWGMVAVIAAVDLVAGLIVMVAVRRLAIRLLPLAMLLSLSLVFPDQAPHRFKIALRANSSARLRSRIVASRDEDTDLATTTEDLLTFLAALARHDRATRGHCERVRAFVDLLANELKLSQADQDRLRWAALFHDIGKLEVPGSILRKPGKPTKTEWDTLKRHPVDGAKLIKPLVPWLGPWALAVEQHHERFDGGGYPQGLSGHDISFGGRILAVADAYEVMITSRPYKRPVRPEAARQELVSCAGAQFDPDVVRAFLSIAIGDLRKVMGALGVLAEVPLLATVPRAEALIEMAGRQTVGIVSTAAGSGAIIAAASITSMHAPAAVTPNPRPVTHTAAALTSSKRAEPLSINSSPVSTASGSSTSNQEPSAAKSQSPQPTTAEPTQNDGQSGSTPSTQSTDESSNGGGVDSPEHEPAGSSVDGATSTVGSTVEGATSTVGSTVEGATSTVGSTVEGVTSTVGSTVKGATSTVGSTVEGATSTVGGLIGGLTGNTPKPHSEDLGDGDGIG